MSFTGKSVIVTGGAQGIGKAISIAFAHAGARVFVADMDEEAGEEFAADMTAAGQPITFVPTDMAEEVSVSALVERVGDEAKAVHVLVNNAGVGDHADPVARSMAHWDRVLAINLRGPYMLVKYAVPLMPPGSAIVNISSTRALMSEPNTEPYSASKGGLLALTHALAVSLADRRIRVNAICPGWIEVSAWRKSRRRGQIELRPEDHSQHPAGRVGRPEDIAEACVFLADSDKSGFITGQSLVIDGGMTIKMIYIE